jgi:hypothetical protein
VGCRRRAGAGPPVWFAIHAPAFQPTRLIPSVRLPDRANLGLKIKPHLSMNAFLNKY